MNKLMLRNRTYDFFKNVAQIYLPAAGTAYFSLAAIWGLPEAKEVVGTVVVIDTLLGAFLKLSQVAYNNSDERFDGTVYVDRSAPINNPDVVLKDVEAPVSNEMRLKVEDTESPIPPAKPGKRVA